MDQQFADVFHRWCSQLIGYSIGTVTRLQGVLDSQSRFSDVMCFGAKGWRKASQICCTPSSVSSFPDRQTAGFTSGMRSGGEGGGTREVESYDIFGPLRVNEEVTELPRDHRILKP